MELVMIENIIWVCKVFRFAETGYNLFGIGKTLGFWVRDLLKPDTITCFIELKSVDADFVWVDTY